MKLHGELTARTILGCRTRANHNRIIGPELVHLSTASPLDDPATSIAVGRVLELRMAEQTHSDHASRAGSD